MRRSIPVVLLLILAIAVLPGCQKMAARKELKKGNGYYKEENYRDALAQFQKGLQLDPEAKFAWRSVGLSAMAMFKPGNMGEENLKLADIAIEAFRNYVEAFPRDEKVMDYLINMYINSQKYADAIEYLQKYRQASPLGAKVLQPLLTLMVKAGRIDDAYKLVLTDAPQDAVSFYTIAVNAWDKAYHDPLLDITARKSVVDTGLRAITRALDIKPDFQSMAYINLLYREKGKLAVNDKEKQNLWTAGADAWAKKAVKVREEAKRIEEQQKQQEQPPQKPAEPKANS
jgi:tetratricopeptide (TPR) repeat protein